MYLYIYVLVIQNQQMKIFFYFLCFNKVFKILDLERIIRFIFYQLIDMGLENVYFLVYFNQSKNFKKKMI